MAVRVPQDGYARVRLEQMRELTAYIKGRASARSIGTIVAGDFNKAPETLEIAVFKVTGRLGNFETRS